MEYRFNTPLNGNIAMTYHYHEDAALRRDKSLYKFVWVQSGTLDIEVDHVVMHLEKDEINGKRSSKKHDLSGYRMSKLQLIRMKGLTVYPTVIRII